MSSSDEETVAVTKKVQDKNSKKAGAKAEKSTPAVDFQIKPAKGGPSMDTSSWPLLLKVSKPQITCLSLLATGLLPQRLPY
jgi:hypothetical protein